MKLLRAPIRQGSDLGDIFVIIIGTYYLLMYFIFLIINFEKVAN